MARCYRAARQPDPGGTGHPQKAKVTGQPGRPTGSQNRDQTPVELTPELLSSTYLVLDGHFGNYHARQMVREGGLQVVSKLRCDAALQ